MKKTAILINTSRGPVVDEAALVQALKNKEIWGAGLDVFENEPALAPGLLECENAVLLPHVASATIETRTNMGLIAVRNILAVLNGVTFVTYAVDKSAAQRGAWRTSEKTLHLLALLGGWPAAWWAQQWMRHKSSKASFRMVYWCTVLLHSAALGAIVWQPGWLPFSGFH